MKDMTFIMFAKRVGPDPQAVGRQCSGCGGIFLTRHNSRSLPNSRHSYGFTAQKSKKPAYMKRTLPAVLGVILLSTPLVATASPNFVQTGAMISTRQEHTATLLPNGKVLVAAGSLNNNYTSLSSAELFNPANGLWRNTGSLNTPRMRQPTTLLPNGKVLVAGGDNLPSTGWLLSSAELYDPATETWTNTGSLNIGRELHTATLLSNGKVLVVGGHGSDNLASAELYDPATGTWTNTGSLNAARFHHTATYAVSSRRPILCPFAP